MIERGEGGRIVNVSSSSAFRARSHVAYASSKAAIVQLSRSAAAELGPHEINVNAVAPGLTRTGMTGDRDIDADARDGYPLEPLRARRRAAGRGRRDCLPVPAGEPSDHRADDPHLGGPRRLSGPRGSRLRGTIREAARTRARGVKHGGSRHRHTEPAGRAAPRGLRGHAGARARRQRPSPGSVAAMREHSALREIEPVPDGVTPRTATRRARTARRTCWCGSTARTASSLAGLRSTGFTAAGWSSAASTATTASAGSRRWTSASSSPRSSTGSRRSTPYPAPIEDCYAGLKWFAGAAGELGIDPARGRHRRRERGRRALRRARACSCATVARSMSASSCSSTR